MTRRTRGLAVILPISASAFSRERRVLPRARSAARSSGLLAALATVVPSNRAARGPARFRGAGQDGAPPGPADHPAGVMGGHRPEPLLVTMLRADAGRAVRSGQWLAGTDPA
ncbi:MAG: hypothetical protein ACYCO9_07625 [Streptosporangiaceae bacterium]